MSINCGTDIIEIDRIKASIEELGDKFLNRVFTSKEIEYCESKKNMKYQHYAARFAAKEAVFKAVSSMLSDKYEIGWKNIEILNGEDGKPRVNFVGFSFTEINDIDISISHCREFAVAMVVLCFKECNG